VYVLFSGNRSGLAGLVHRLRQGEPLTELTGSRPLALTIEMGIEKLRRDYSYALLATGSATDPCTGAEQYRPIRHWEIYMKKA
jgi:hypothetical protein